MQTVYLSRRNILTLLSKLDRQKAGEETACAIVKRQDRGSPYCMTVPVMLVGAAEPGCSAEYCTPHGTHFVILERHSLNDLLNGNIINVPPPAAMGDGVIVVPVSDEEMYANRSAGEMHPADEANLPKPATGVIQHEGLPPPRRWVY